MSGVHLHLLLNHIPVLGTIGALLLLVAGLWSKSDDIRRASLYGFVLIALLTIPVYLTGDPAKDAVRGLPGVTRALVEEHEAAALFGMISASITGVFALVAIIAEIKRPGIYRKLTIAVPSSHSGQPPSSCASPTSEASSGTPKFVPRPRATPVRCNGRGQPRTSARAVAPGSHKSAVRCTSESASACLRG
jgi:hypothetical protein